jgi:hypothetical protein
MIATFDQNLQVQNLAQRIAQEAGSSHDGRVYQANILTKLGILNSIIKALGEKTGAITKDVKGLSRLTPSGLTILTKFEREIPLWP